MGDVWDHFQTPPDRPPPRAPLCSEGSVGYESVGADADGDKPLRPPRARFASPDSPPIEPFLVPPTPDVLRAIPRGAVLRRIGCSMRDWSGLLLRRLRRAPPPRLSAAEVRRHATGDDLWLVVHGVAYDCTAFQHFHPGGGEILRRYAGRDCTALYDHYHPWVSCEGMLAPFAVGRIDQTES